MHKIITFSVLLFIVSIMLVCKCNAQNKPLKQDTSIAVTLTDLQEKYFLDLEKQISLLETKKFDVIMLILSSKDSTYTQRLLQFPIHQRKRLFITIKK